MFLQARMLPALRFAMLGYIFGILGIIVAVVLLVMIFRPRSTPKTKPSEERDPAGTSYADPVEDTDRPAPEQPAPARRRKDGEVEKEEPRG